MHGLGDMALYIIIHPSGPFEASGDGTVGHMPPAIHPLRFGFDCAGEACEAENLPLRTRGGQGSLRGTSRSPCSPTAQGGALRAHRHVGWPTPLKANPNREAADAQRGRMSEGLRGKGGSCCSCCPGRSCTTLKPARGGGGADRWM